MGAWNILSEASTRACHSVAFQGAYRNSLQLLPKWSAEAAVEHPDLSFKKIFLGERMLVQEIRQAIAHAADSGKLIGCLRESGDFVMVDARTRAVTWQLRVPPLLAAYLTTGKLGKAQYRRFILNSDTQAFPNCAVILLLSAGKAALGMVRYVATEGHASFKAELGQHKVISTYAVRGGEKQGTGRFQLFEDARGRSCRSEGAKLRRRCATRFFEKINTKLQEWSAKPKEHAWPPVAVFFVGDQRLKHLLYECSKPNCPLADDKGQWITISGRLLHTHPSLESLQRVAKYISQGELVQRLDQQDC